MIFIFDAEMQVKGDFLSDVKLGQAAGDSHGEGCDPRRVSKLFVRPRRWCPGEGGREFK